MDTYDEDMWEKFEDTDEFLELRRKYHTKYAPKVGEIEWYQWRDAPDCMTLFVATLIENAIDNVDCIYTVVGSNHSVVCFVRHGITFYADLMNDWESVSELKLSMGTIEKYEMLHMNRRTLIYT